MVKEIKTSNAEKCGEQSWERRGLGGDEQRAGRAFGTEFGKEFGNCSP